MPVVRIEGELCKGCELCIPFCPYGSLVMSRQLNELGLPMVSFKEGSQCSGCRHCVIMCPEAAIEIFQ